MDNLFPNRRWLILPAEMTGSLDFNQIIQTSTDNLRFNADRTKFLVKYDVEEVTEPYNIHHIDADTGETMTESIEVGVYNRPFIYTPGMKEYTYPEIMEVLLGEEWNPFYGENLS